MKQPSYLAKFNSHSDIWSESAYALPSYLPVPQAAAAKPEPKDVLMNSVVKIDPVSLILRQFGMQQAASLIGRFL